MDIVESLLYIPTKFVWEYRGQENSNDSAVQATENAKHFEEKETNWHPRFLQEQKFNVLIVITQLGVAILNLNYLLRCQMSRVSYLTFSWS